MAMLFTEYDYKKVLSTALRAWAKKLGHKEEDLEFMADAEIALQVVDKPGSQVYDDFVLAYQEWFTISKKINGDAENGHLPENTPGEDRVRLLKAIEKRDSTRKAFIAYLKG